MYSRDLKEKGWLVAPHETKEHLCKRRQDLEEAKKIDVGGESLPMSLLVAAHAVTKSLYGFCLEEAILRKGSKGLSLWQGAVLWSCKEGELLFPLIQISERKSFFFYLEEEILAHELVHAARFAFKEPLFEEILAYHTSKSWIKRFFGPLFLFPIEPVLCLVIALVGWVASPWIFWGVFSMLLLRLGLLQGLFALARAKLARLGMQHPLFFLIALSDLDVCRVALLRLENIGRYFQKNREKNLYYQTIFALFRKEMDRGE